MNKNILYKFAKDLSQLYANVRINKIEDHFIKVAQALDSEVEKWLLKSVQLDLKSSLLKPEVLDTLILLSRLRKTYSSGMNTSELVKVFTSDSKLRFFLPIIIALREIASSGNYAILSPYRSILDASQTMSISAGGSDVGSITQDITLIDNQFREEIDRKLNRSFEEESISTKSKKVTKKEKLGLLLTYLTKRFAEEIVLAFEENGQIDTIGLTESEMVLRDPRKIMENMFPNYSIGRMPFLVKYATALANSSVKTLDPQYYDHVYNDIKTQIMYLSSTITLQQYNKYRYDAMLRLHTTEPDNFSETDNIKTQSSVWLYPQNLLMLSITLFMIGSKIR